VAFAALADDGRKLAAAREHDAAAQAAPSIPAPTPLAHLPGRVVFRSVASNSVAETNFSRGELRRTFGATQRPLCRDV
jgi:hypothetical protein